MGLSSGMLQVGGGAEQWYTAGRAVGLSSGMLQVGGGAQQWYTAGRGWD